MATANAPTPAAPTVSRLPPDPALLYQHHGVASGSRIALPEALAPRYFHNPWPSYRMASLNDAWLAYQKGAAIATPQLGGNAAASSSKVSLSASCLGSKPDDEEAAQPLTTPPFALHGFRDPADDSDDEPLNDDAEEWPKRQHPPEPVRGYVRPAFSRILSADDASDWREPPVRVEEARWQRSPRSPSITWLGHAGAFVQIPWADEREGAAGVLFDPIFSYRCSPSQLVGPARYLQPPCGIDELPPVHVCCISHDHYDHLDYNTIIELWNFHQATIHFFVPLGLAQWFKSCGIPDGRITELDWWLEALVSFPPDGSAPGAVDTTYPPPPDSAPTVNPGAALTLKVAFTPAQHRSGRGVFDHMTSLWGSWAVGVVAADNVTSALKPGMAGWTDFKVYFGGDTGYRYATAPEHDSTAVCPAFKEIGQRYGPFSLALLPLSTGSSLPFLRSLLQLSLDQYTLTSSLHCSPADSMLIHADVKAERSVGIHWGTFCDAAEARATRVEFGRARRSHGLSSHWEHPGEQGCFVMTDIGETLDL
ncbi:N-acyl-phosphatidylethanolamine-hydrolyzing phospholipase D [Vanrija pseudolonga]|uniref:N-acyl-phosphatidylethanolamine-hydrolyzing phospholipase D n=1 Tax=Vanrija pseudolonga TaxID=143232 RepID=A0AAF0YHA1_9TREE|nr:N-acyl-phosphatidylethanolamine-hydrolyzing phospholipase D [Vanrija pseudolonga]